MAYVKTVDERWEGREHQAKKSCSSVHRRRRRRLRRREEASKCRLAIDIYRDSRGRPRRDNENSLIAWSSLATNDPRFAIDDAFRGSSAMIFMALRNVSLGLSRSFK